jgi:hypothetical protein
LLKTDFGKAIKRLYDDGGGEKIQEARDRLKNFVKKARDGCPKAEEKGKWKENDASPPEGAELCKYFEQE